MPGAIDGVLRYDARGHGQTAVPEGPYSIEMLTADAVALLDALDIERVRFVGCSKGGMIGQMLATRHGDRLIAAILASTAAKAGTPEIWNGRIEAVRQGGMESVADATIERWFTPAGIEQMPAEIARVRAMVAATPDASGCGCD